MIKFLPTKEVLPLRSKILRNGKITPENCTIDNDDVETSFHLGFLLDDEIVCVASFHQEKKDGFVGVGYRLRGMATNTNFQGKGYGNRLVNFAIVYLRGQTANYLWCNAREIAYKFYLGLGFEFISDSFEIEGIGTHRVMFLKIM